MTKMVPIHIFYASETGNSEDVAFYLYLSLCSRNVGSKRTVSLNSTKNFDASVVLEGNNNVIALFVVSTCGDGDVPRSMRDMWNLLLRKNLPNNLFAGLRFGVFGLGDSSYEKYNASARKLFVRLKQLGATPLLDVGLGDDQAAYGYFGGFDVWKKSLLSILFPVSNNTKESDDNQTHYPEDVYFVDISNRHLNSTDSDSIVFSDGSSFVAEVTKNERLTKHDWFQDIRLISLKLPDSSEKCTYQPGDVATVFYQNPRVWVDKLIAIYAAWYPELQLHSNTALRIQRQENVPFRENHLPSVECSLDDLFTKYLDICAVPRRSSFLILTHWTASAEEQGKLLELSAAEGTDLYYEYCVREKRNIVEIFEDFRSLRVPLYKLLELVPLVAPRSYSIASALSSHPQQLELCVGIATHRTKYGRIRPGLCTSYLSTLSSGSHCRIALREGMIKHTLLATQHQRPLILVGPGTGIAPMRGIVYDYFHSLWAKEASSSVSPAPQILLFTGCRKRDADFIFAEEWRTIQDSLAAKSAVVTSSVFDSISTVSSSSLPKVSTGESLLTVIPAFSQDQLIKEYVTHKIKASALTLWRMIKQGACIFVCGSAARMPKDVKRAFVEVIVAQTGVNESDAEKVLQDLVRTKRYVVESW